MLASIPSRLFREWIAYDRIEPFGEWREDIRAGIIASTIANVNRDPKKSQAYTPSDFVPEFRMKEAEPCNVNDKVLAIAKALGAKRVKRKKI